MRRIPGTELDVFPLCLGGNVFGWTADEAAAFAVLDAYHAAGGNFLDTADIYPWFPGGGGGSVSEEMIGRWCRSRGVREEIVIATKVGDEGGLGRENILRGVEASLRRLQTDRIDLYFAHVDDPETPLEETLAAFGELVQAGKVRHIAASDHTPQRLTKALAVSAALGVPGYVALQTEYNLVERGYEAELRGAVDQAGIAALPYFSLAQGFLTGKYRTGSVIDSPRADDVRHYARRGGRVLAALERVAGERSVPMAAVALAWLLAQPTVAAVLASARSPEQLSALLPAAALCLSDEEVAELSQTGPGS